MLNHRRFGSGRTVVLQHGFLGGGGYFAPAINHLAPHFDVIAPDLPGFAGSAGTPSPESLEGFTEVLVEFLSSIGVEKFSFLGHSTAGMIAQQIALDYPDRVERLVLYGTASAGELPQRFETFDQTIAKLESNGIDASARGLAAAWFVNGENDPFYEFCVSAGAGADLDSAIRTLRAVEKWRVTDRLNEIDMPTLIICGDMDCSTHPEESIALWRGIRGSKLCIVPDCAHNVHLEMPEVFNRVLSKFLLTGAA
jgi:2-hydroxy-6-oxonona-2,4-dienedioate hydrolase